MPPVSLAPMQAGEGVKAFACTLDKIGHGEPCSFEGQLIANRVRDEDL